jgi:NADPH:quinone reductase-like Zn-dependent oxidoreductase
LRRYEFASFGLDKLELVERDIPAPGPGEIVLDVEAFSLNYRDLLVVKGSYNPGIALPATPVSDAAGTVAAAGPGVTRVKPGDRVMTHFVSDWIEGPFERRYVSSTLGVPGPGVAAERVLLPERAVLPVPRGYGSAQASTLPIAALTAWNALVTEGGLKPGAWILTLGTGGVSIFALQLAKAMKARVAITSSSDEKLERARALGADFTVNYEKNPRWDKDVLEATGGQGADVVVETGGIATLGASLKAARAGGLVAVLGGVTGLSGEVGLAPLTMKRLRVHGILVDSRAHFEDFVRYLEEHPIEPVIDRRFRFEELGAAFRHMEAGAHFGKIVVERTRG